MMKDERILPGLKVTLGKKLFFYTGVILAGVLLTTFFFLVRGQSKQWEEHLRAQNISFARFATPELLKQFRGDFPSRATSDLNRVYDFLGFNRDLIRFSLYSPGGRLLFQSPLFPDHIDLVLPEQIGADFKSRLEVPRITAQKITLVAGGQILDLVAPAFGPTGEHLISARYLISYESVARRQAEMRHQFFRIGLAALLVSLVLAAVVARRVSGPIGRLTGGIQAIGRGELQTRMKVQGSDEIAALARSFNEMSANLAASQDALNETNRELRDANEELQKIQAQLLRSERLAATGQLAAGISHEIDNPVGIILGYAELLLEDCPPDDPRAEDLRAIIEECKRCKRITGGLLGLARSGDGVREPVDLDRLCRETIVSLSPQRLFKEVVIDYVRPLSPLIITGDSDQLRQILVNLMLNAAQAMDGRGKLCVRLKQEDDFAAICVADTGPGIPENQRDKIFEPFFSTKGRDEGTGLGLSLCRKLAEEHNGDLSLDSTSRDGTEISLRIPLQDTEKYFDKVCVDSLG